MFGCWWREATVDLDVDKQRPAIMNQHEATQPQKPTYFAILLQIHRLFGSNLWCQSVNLLSLYLAICGVHATKSKVAAPESAPETDLNRSAVHMLKMDGEWCFYVFLNRNV